ncbi:outer membrane beta-barrel protein [Deltaproteobacteria bacterium OttesenSCG-928-K17]|nr:outer membrane beta-barrel protein [Deltaproteobacteria bacterium OttesenSCG-928-K17]
MKIKQFLTGLALAGALALGTTAAADAQFLDATEGYYVTPKLLYSNGKFNDFSSNGVFGGGFNDTRTGKYTGKDGSSSKFGGGFAVGYDYGVYSEYPVRLELEYLYHGKHDKKFGMQSTGTTMSSKHKVEADIHTLFANAYLDFPTDTNFTPYVGAGIGSAYVDASVKTSQRGTVRHPDLCSANPGGGGNPCPSYDFDVNGDPRGSQSSWNFAWNLSAGMAYQIKDNMALDISYRYSDYGKIDFGTNKYRLSAQSWYDNAGTWEGGVRDLGTFSSKSKVDLTSHEVIFGLRITGY